jgi:hypothetical protein
MKRWNTENLVYSYRSIISSKNLSCDVIPELFMQQKSSFLKIILILLAIAFIFFFPHIGSMLFPFDYAILILLEPGFF